MQSRLVLLSLLLAGAAAAQSSSDISVVYLKFTAQPPTLFSGSHDMDHVLIEACNDGPAPVSLPWERISMSADRIRFIGAQDAAILIAAKQQRSVANVIARVGGLLAQGLAIGLAAANGRANAGWTTGLSIAGSVAPDVVRIARSQETPVAPPVSATKYPFKLDRNQCFSDYQFASKLHFNTMRSTIVFGETSGNLTADIQKLIASHPVGQAEEISVH